MRGISTRVLDASTGLPAANIPVRLERHYEGQWHPAGIAITDAQGRAHLLGENDDEPLQKSDYRLTFEVAAYFKTSGVKACYPFVPVVFSVSELRHYHLLLLLSPFGYSTYLES